MKKVKVFLGIGFANANREEILEFEDDATEEDIEDEVMAWVNDQIDIGWKVI